MKKDTIAIGMSGGVDSSVAAFLLKNEGYNIIGITMKLIDDQKTCDSIKDAKIVCDQIGITHHVIDLTKEFKNIVINNFIDSYKNGQTPNPCVVCNKYFKFGLFWEKAQKLGATKIATGHYAKIENGKLKMANSIDKDQSYFLYGINKNMLNKILFPLSEYENKNEIRAIANKLGLKTKEKKDRQEICFIPDDNYISFLKENINERSINGDICLANGTVIGKHNGLINYTIGQRKGLGISYNKPLYVTEICKKENKIIVGNNDDLYKDTLIATNLNFLVDNIENNNIYVKIRSRAKLSKASISIENDKMTVKFTEKQRAITKGQSVVLYDKNLYCLGGGIIDQII